MDKNKNEFINKIVLKLVKYEPERKKRLSQLRLICAIPIIIISMIALIFVVSIIALISHFSFLNLLPTLFGLHWVFMLLAIMLTIVLTVRTFFDKNFKKYLKENCQKDILQTFNLESIKEEGFSDELLKQSNLFSNFDYIIYDDVIKGNYNNVDYKIAESELRRAGSKKEHMIFNGVIISFQSNKKIVADTLIVSKEAKKLSLPEMFSLIISILMPLASGIFLLKNGYIIQGIFFSLMFIASITLLFFVNKNKMQSVKLEDTDFLKRFDVFTQNQVEARYIIIPAFMERLKSLETSFGTMGIKCSFFQDQIMIAIPIKKDLFEVGSLFKSLGRTENIKEFYDEITSIQNMIDHFKLAEKTGL